MMKRDVQRDDRGRQFIKIEDVYTHEDTKRAESLLETRDFGSFEDTLYEVVLRRLRNQGHKVFKRRYTDPMNVIYLQNTNPSTI